MKKFFAVLTVGIVLSALSACGATAPATSQTPAQLLSTIQVKAQKVCAVGAPFLASMVAMKSQLSASAQADLSTASDKVNSACTKIASTSAGSFSTVDVTTLVNDGVPALIRVIDASNWDQKTKDAAELAITAAQLAVTTALASYVGTPAAASPDPASGVLAS